MTIAQIRSAIDALNWTRSDLSGGTSEEFRRANVPARFERHIATCRDLVIPARFAREIESRQWAIERAEAMIARWEGRQVTA